MGGSLASAAAARSIVGAGTDATLRRDDAAPLDATPLAAAAAAGVRARPCPHGAVGLLMRTSAVALGGPVQRQGSVNRGGANGVLSHLKYLDAFPKQRDEAAEFFQR